VQFDSKLSDKLGWRGFKDYENGKDAKKFNAVWPTDEEFLKLSDKELDLITLTNICFNQGTNVESLTMELGKYGLMQHPIDNTYTKKVN
jgi:hypothetical protein